MSDSSEPGFDLEPTADSPRVLAGSARERRLVLVASLVIVFFLVDTWPFYPLRLLSTFFHEFSHAAACWMTGGEVREIVIAPNTAGYTMLRGGWPFLVALAGYPGSVFWGSLILLLGFGRLGRTYLLETLGVGVAGLILWFGPGLTQGQLFTYLFGFGTGAALFFAGRRLPPHGEQLLCLLIGTTIALHGLIDIKGFFFSQGWVDTSGARVPYPTDLTALAQITHLPAGLWALFDAALSGAFIYALYRWPDSRETRP